MSSYEENEVEKWQYLGVYYRSTADQANRIQHAVEMTQTYKDYLATKSVLELVRVKDRASLEIANEVASRHADLSHQITGVVLRTIKNVLRQDEQ